MAKIYQGKTALITGASAGIGLEYSKAALVAASDLFRQKRLCLAAVARRIAR